MGNPVVIPSKFSSRKRRRSPVGEQSIIYTRVRTAFRINQYWNFNRLSGPGRRPSSLRSSRDPWSIVQNSWTTHFLRISAAVDVVGIVSAIPRTMKRQFCNFGSDFRTPSGWCLQQQELGAQFVQVREIRKLCQVQETGVIRLFFHQFVVVLGWEHFGKLWLNQLWLSFIWDEVGLFENFQLIYVLN